MKVQNFFRLVSVMLCLLAWCIPVWAQQLIWLGVAQGVESRAWGVSSDGKTVVGVVYDANQIPYVFRWTQSGGYDTTTFWGIARDVNDTGTIFVGQYLREGVFHAFRKVLHEPAEDLGSFSDPGLSEAWAVSDSGTVVVGWAQDANGNRRAFRWVADSGIVDLGTFGGTESYAYDVSADGYTVVGWAQDSTGLPRASLWKPGQGLQVLNHIQGGYPWGWATGISPEGDVVVGWLVDANNQSWLFRWTEREGLQIPGDLRDLFNFSGAPEVYARAASHGNIIVGYVQEARSEDPFRWTPQRGLEDLNMAYASLLTDGSELYAATDVSPDGRYIVGWGRNGTTGRIEAYLLDTGTSTAVEEETPDAAQPVSLWPNPFREAVRIRFSVPISGHVRLIIYDLLGRSVRTLLEGPLALGVHEVVWDGRSDTGIRLPAGIYLLRLETGDQTEMQRILLIE